MLSVLPEPVNCYCFPPSADPETEPAAEPAAVEPSPAAPGAEAPAASSETAEPVPGYLHICISESWACKRARKQDHIRQDIVWCGKENKAKIRSFLVFIIYKR